MKRTIITYGTFDVFHVGHLNVLRRLKALGNELLVGVSTDEFNAVKGKQILMPYAQRATIVSAIDCVDRVIPEENWEQKRSDIQAHNVDVFGMGSDWKGKFDHLGDICEVVYLERTEGVSTTEIKTLISSLNQNQVQDFKRALELITVVGEDLR